MTVQHKTSFGEWIHFRRKQLDLTQMALAQRTGCSVSAIRKIEADQRRPSRQIAALLASALEVPPELVREFIRMARAERQPDQADIPIVFGPLRLTREDRVQPGLPMTATPIIGRGKELAYITEQLSSRACRLLSICGIGGIGKSRLAIEVARQIEKSFTGGALFISLESTQSSLHIPGMINNLLVDPVVGDHHFEEKIIARLATQDLLFVFDGMDNLLDGARFINELLCRTNLSMIVTSVQRLDVQGECVIELDSLPSRPISLGQEGSIEETDAGRLFIQMATRADHHFRFQQTDRPFLTSILHRTGGIPLAIELAASWVRFLSLEEIAEEIKHNLDFLSSTAVGKPDRHRSMRAVFDHTWSLLSAEEQYVFSRLSIFRGGFTRQAAEFLTGATLNILTRLQDRSLLYRTHDKRYEVHELLRQYSLEKLRNNPGAHTSVMARYCDYYSTWIARHDGKIQGENRFALLDEMELETENIRSAWHWAVDNQLYPQILQMTLSLSRVFELRGCFSEGVEMFQWTVDQLQEKLSTPARSTVKKTNEEEHLLILGKLFLRLADFHLAMGELTNSEKYYQLLLEQYKSANFHEMVVEALIGTAKVATQSGKLEFARNCLFESLDLSRMHTLPRGKARSQMMLGFVSQIEGMPDRSIKSLRAALQLWREERCLLEQGLCMALLAYAAASIDISNAQNYLSASEGINELLGDSLLAAVNSLIKGYLLTKEGSIEQAINVLLGSVTHFEKISQFWGMAVAYNWLATAYQYCGNYRSAAKYFACSLNLCNQFGFHGLTLAAVNPFAETLDMLNYHQLADKARSAESALEIGSLLETLSTEIGQ